MGGRRRDAKAAALVTQLATALVCLAHSLSSSSYESSAVVKVTSSLDLGKKKKSLITFKRCLLKCWPQPEKCSLYTACAI